MKWLLPSILCLFFSPILHAQDNWMSSAESGVDDPNTWIAFRRNVVFKSVPKQVIATIGAESKYWLWINGKMVVFEGGLKRGPNPNDTYYDKIDLAPYLQKGENQLAVLVWHFGKDGFSHKSSACSGLFFSMDTKVGGDRQWVCRIHPAYGTADKPLPNLRLSESNIKFDARKDIDGWQTGSLQGFSPVVLIGAPGDIIWNNMVYRPIPQWKDYGIKEASCATRGNVITAELPYNMQMTPVITFKDTVGGRVVKISTDHSVAGGTDNIRAEYVTKAGVHEYESYGWMNGEKIILTLPPGVEILSVKYRETGYDTTPEGTFECSDAFFNRYWKKALRTVYVNMRDNYFDCPDRERAQWWGDVVLLMGESFYTYSTSTHQLMRKAMHELVEWQGADSILRSPIPGIWDRELPDQMLASIGRYGFWNYYMHTGDLHTIRDVYPAVKKYLAVWKLDHTGMTKLRAGGWLWGDWGDNLDMRLIQAGWHHLALEGAANMAEALGYNEDAEQYRKVMDSVKTGFNKYWNGYAYRDPSYQGATDDRIHALAVISGIADQSKYPQILQIFQSQKFASPYMEKYVMEALFEMNQGNYALARARNRFTEMVNDSRYTTLFEGWGVGERGFGGGTTNHAWSGGAQIVLAQYMCGITPLEPGYKTFLIEPSPAAIKTAEITVPTVKGTIGSAFAVDSGRISMKVQVPAGTVAVVRVQFPKMTINNREPSAAQLEVPEKWQRKGYTAVQLPAGNYTILTQKK